MADIQILSIPYPHSLQAQCTAVFFSEDYKEKFNIRKDCVDKARVLIIDGIAHRNLCIRCAKLKYPSKEKDFDLYGHKT